MTKAEQETIIRCDQEERVWHLYTAHEPTARSWTRLGYDVQVSDYSRGGHPRGWRAVAPLGALRFRTVRAGQVLSKPRGRGFTRKLADSEGRKSTSQPEALPEEALQLVCAN